MAKHIPEHFLRDLLSRIDIVDVIKNRVPIKKRGANYLGICPFHQEKSPSFTVSQAKQFYHCFGCGKHGNVFGFLMDYEQMGFVEAIEELAKSLSLDVPYEGGGTEVPKENFDDLYKLMHAAQDLFEQNLRTHKDKNSAINYLKKRGLTGVSAKHFGLGFAPEAWDVMLQHLKKISKDESLLLKTGLLIRHEEGRLYDRFRNRIMFPIHDTRGRVIGFGGRVIDKGEPKYLNSPETPIFHKGRTLYGLYEAKQALKQLRQIIIVEGYMDVVMLAQAGISYAVATLGTATTEDHIRNLLKETKELIFCFDGDRAGRDAAWRALKVCLPFMSGSCNMRFLFLPEGEDPDTLVQKEGKEQFEQRISKALPLGEFLLSECAKPYDLKTIAGKSQYLEDLKTYFEKIPQGVYRIFLEETLAKRLSLMSEQLNTLLDNKVQQANSAKGTPKTLEMPERALALILAHPNLAQKFTLPDLSEQAIEKILRELWDFCSEQQPQHFGIILAQYNDHTVQPLLIELSTHPYTEMIKDPETELADILEKLKNRVQESRFDYLLKQSQQGELSAEEKAELKALLVRKV